MKGLKTSIIGVLILLLPLTLMAQSYTSNDNNTGNWVDASSWNGAQPPNDDVALGTGTLTLFGYVTWQPSPTDSTLNFANATGAGADIVIEDTLVIIGNLHLGNKVNLTVNGILIIYGDFSSTNQVDIASTGFLIVQGDMNFGGAQGDIVGDASNVYIGGDCNNGTNCGSTSNDSTDLDGTDIDVGDFYDENDPVLNAGTIGTSNSICSGDVAPKISNISSPSPVGTITISWQSSTNSTDPATGTWNVVTDSTRNELYPGALTQTTSFFRRVTEGAEADTSNVVTITVNPLPTVSLSVPLATDTICTGENAQIIIDFTLGTAPFSFTVSRDDEIPVTTTEDLTNISTDPYTYIPLTQPVWVNDGSPDTDYTYSVTVITDNNGCVNSVSQGNEKITVLKIPQTGPQYHIPNN